jgi:hypothetical protein
MNSLVAIPNTIHLSHPRICAFYEKNPSISPEAINLLIIDLFETTTEPDTVLEKIIATAHNEYQITELRTAFEQIKTAISEKTSALSSGFLLAKTKYVNEFRSIWMQTNCVSKRKLLLENNDVFINILEHLTYEIRNIKGIHHIMSDKITTIIKQFHKIIHTNIESILSKSVDTNTLSKEFIQNFEINSAHMIQTIQQQLCDFVSAKEKHIKTTIGALSAKSEANSTIYSKLLYELNDFLHHFAVQPTISDNTPNFEIILSRLYNTAFIQSDNTTSPASNFVLSRLDKPELFIQQCTITDRNINMDEVSEFLQSAESQNRDGILISQHTGITSKPHLFIEIIHSRVFLYVHNMEYSPEKLKIAIEIVDTISSKLSEFNVSSEDKYAIPKEVLDEMNREYQSFISQKELILNTLKETHKKLVGQIEDMRFVSLDKYLSTRYSSCKKQGYVCSLCNSFTVSTLKGLAAHKRGCNRKLSGVSTTQKTTNEPIKILLIPKDTIAVSENRVEIEL